MNDDINTSQLGKVAVLMGGEFAEREISLMSGEKVLAALRRQGIDADAIDVDKNLAQRLVAGKYDRVFNALHGTFGEDGTVQGLLEALRIPYTGSGVMASALAMDKPRCKMLWRANGLATPDFVIMECDRDMQRAIDELGFPMFVKPAYQGGSSIGTTKVHGAQQLQDAWRIARKYDRYVLAEKMIDGEEYTVPLLANECLPSIHIATPQREFYDYQAKYFDDTTVFTCPSALSETREQELQMLAKQAYDIIGCRHVGRVDVMADQSGKFWLLEINTIPGFTEHSLVPMSARQAGIEFDQLMLKILQQTLANTQR
ncbi:MAG: D-alanine--D-alanine ligase [Gammaproteobacteria bacterium]